MFIRRSRGREPDPPGVLSWRLGLFFLAAGVWLAGVVIGDDRVTGAAIVILLVAVVIRLFGRRSDVDDGDPEEPHPDTDDGPVH